MAVSVVLILLILNCLLWILPKFGDEDGIANVIQKSRYNFKLILKKKSSIMASGFIGSVGEYNAAAERFESYQERPEQFLFANDIGNTTATDSAEVEIAEDKKKIAVLISTIGSKTYRTLRDLCSPINPKEKSFAELCTLLQNHFKPKNIEVASTYKFHQCIQEKTESVSEYSARLRRFAVDCNFGTFLTRALRDQFINEIRNSSTKKKLLGQESLSFEDAMETAVADEAAKKETQLLQNQRYKYSPVHAFGSSRSPKSSTNKHVPNKISRSPNKK